MGLLAWVISLSMRKKMTVIKPNKKTKSKSGRNRVQ
jgi:hypothetical protein